MYQTSKTLFDHMSKHRDTMYSGIFLMDFEVFWLLDSQY